MVRRKAVSPLVSYMLVVFLIISGVVIVLTMGMPLLERSRQVASIQSAQDTLLNIDSKIRQTVSYGEGSRTEASITTDYGRYTFEPANDTFYYTIETEADVVSAGSQTRIGPVNMSSSDGVNIKLSLDYSDEKINLTDPDGRERINFGQGFFNLRFRNRGETDGKVSLEVGYR